MPAVTPILRWSKSWGNPWSGELDLRHVILEVHYDEAQDLAGLHDRSGVRLWAVKDNHAVRHRVGVLSVGDPFAIARLPQDLPPGQPDVEVAVHCPPGCTQKFHAPMHAFASMTHAHLRARHVITTISNRGDNGAVVEGGWREVVDAGARRVLT